MAVAVSHAMRRYPVTPPDTSYSAFSLRSDSHHSGWPGTVEDGGSALSRSMRYAEPWLYGSVRAPAGLVLTPALVLCSCADYTTGTKRSSKKGPTVCKKCKGTRLPLAQAAVAPGTLKPKYGTVRGHSTTASSAAVNGGSARAGTMRVSSSSSRPSILPNCDPYDLMRRSRLAVSEPGGSQFRARSISPSKARLGDNRSMSAGRLKSVTSPADSTRKSILECDVNPYELMTTSDPSMPEASITAINGQRIRVRPSDGLSSAYEDVHVKKQPSATASSAQSPSHIPKLLQFNTKSPSVNGKASSQITPQSTITHSQNYSNHQVSFTSPNNHLLHHLSSPNLNTNNFARINGTVASSSTISNFNSGNCNNAKFDENEMIINESSNRFKSILKKPTTTFSDTDSGGCPERSPSPIRRSGSHFYLPMPVVNAAPRKKVQFLVVENDQQTSLNNNAENGAPEGGSYYDDVELDERKFGSASSVVEQNQQVMAAPCNANEFATMPMEENNRQKLMAKNEPGPCKLRRSLSDRVAQVEASVTFHDTMALRAKTGRPDLRQAFSSITDLQRLDGVGPKVRPKEPPPPPPRTIDPIPIVPTRKAPPAPKPAEIKTQQEPPSAPPRKRSNSKQPTVQIVTNREKLEEKPDNEPVKIVPESPGRTVVQISPVPSTAPNTVHKLQIKNEFVETVNVRTFSVDSEPQRKTSIMINGDDCYSTVNVSDDIQIYQSSVVVNDASIASPVVTNGRSSSVYITGSFVNNSTVSTTPTVTSVSTEVNQDNRTLVTLESTPTTTIAKPKSIEPVDVKQDKENKSKQEPVIKENTNNSAINGNPSSEELAKILRDPVEAVRRNLVPHVCGKSDVPRRPKDTTKRKPLASTNTTLVARLLEDPLLETLAEGLETNEVAKMIEDSLLKLRNRETIDDDDRDACSDASSTQYETMENGSDCSYGNNSNRSSVTEDELGNRTKFYQLLADAALTEIEEHHYESIRANVDPIYEEIEIPPPLPANPPPSSLVDDLQLDKQFTTRSIFEGASKYDILSYLVDAKERGVVQEDSYTYNFGNSVDVVVEEEEDQTVKEAMEAYSSRVSHMSTVSDSSEDSSLVITCPLTGEKTTNGQRSAEVERNDSGVGSETSKSSRNRFRTQQPPEPTFSCEDCEVSLESQTTTESNEPLICRKCVKKRSERKEIITEIVETEEKYSRDLQIILEEFYQPMLVAGLLTPEQLGAIFLNVEELLDNSQALAERLRDTVEIAVEQGDEDLLQVNIGKIFLEAAPMLHAFETYCVRQGAASLLLASLEKDKELLRIFLRVSQMENTMLRRMNLNSFLMVPVQRVTKYPLLLARLHKVTPPQHETRDALKEAQHKIELHLSHMNSETRDVPSKLWRRISSGSGRRSSSEMDLVSIKLRKIAVDVLEWNHDEARFALEGKLLFTQPTDNNWRKGRTIKLTPINAMLVTNGKPTANHRPERADEDGLAFPRHSGVREAALLLIRDKGGRYSLLREPLYLDRCVVAADPAWQCYFEVQELLGKDTFIFKAEDAELTRTWYRQLQYHAQGMGAWRKRRNALANIMINGMGSRS